MNRLPRITQLNENKEWVEELPNGRTRTHDGQVVWINTREAEYLQYIHRQEAAKRKMEQMKERNSK
ncbi:MAG: hypothetical protein RBG13Loki_4262 [Promethearchaeota archaeon CR_4]|nr:MAG: hypothetical protein RBG13Loki_4262 [Candidatus Lokiarchaeota archaeon CR_4]